MKKNFPVRNSNMKVTVTFDKEFTIPFWNISKARRIIEEEVDAAMFNSSWVQIQTSETNFIVYTIFSLSITCRNAKEVKEITERIERKLIDYGEESTL